MSVEKMYLSVDVVISIYLVHWGHICMTVTTLCTECMIKEIYLLQATSLSDV